jgi:hypothetical protein
MTVWTTVCSEINAGIQWKTCIREVVLRPAGGGVSVMKLETVRFGIGCGLVLRSLTGRLLTNSRLFQKFSSSLNRGHDAA